MRGGRGHAFRPAQPGQRVGGVRRRRAVRRGSGARWRGDRRGEIGRQLAAGRVSIVGEHVGRAAAGEIARDDLRRQRNAGAHELLRRDGRRDRLAVDQHAVAIEDDHGVPTTGRQRGQYADASATDHDESTARRQHKSMRDKARHVDAACTAGDSMTSEAKRAASATASSTRLGPV